MAITSQFPQGAPIQPAALQEPADAEPSLGFLAIWRAVRKYWPTAVLAFAAIALASTFFTLSRTKIYQAQATLELDPNPPRPLGKEVDAFSDMGVGTYLDNREYYGTQFKIITSMRVAVAVVNALGLQSDGAFLANKPPGSVAPGKVITAEEAAEVLRSRLSVTPVRDSRLATVQLEDASPVRAQRILSTLIDTYVEQNLQNALASTGAATEWLRSQLDKLKTELESSEMALHDYKVERNLLSMALDDQSNMLREEMKQLNDALTNVRTRRAELTARRRELMKVEANDPSNLPASELLSSPLLQAFRQHYVDSKRDYDSLMGEGKGPEHPLAIAAAARVAVAREALLTEVRNIQGALDRDVAAVAAHEGSLSGMLEHAKRQALDLNLPEIEYNRLLRSKENNEKLYSLVLEKTKESDLTRMMRVNNIHVIDRPLVPRDPVRPKVAINIGIGLLAGVLVGIAAAMGRALLDNTVKTPDDVTRDLGIPFLGLLPEIEQTDSAPQKVRRRSRRRVSNEAVGRKEFIVHERPTSGTAEASRAIRTNLLFMAPDHPYSSLAVTSAGVAEGKTTVACCIAITMAQTGQRVCLVDCDLRRPRVHRIFGENLERGVTSALIAEELNIEEHLIQTHIPNLTVVAAGPLPPNPAETFHSQRFANLLATLKRNFDRVIIDTPPVLAVTDAAILSRLVDGTVLVVRAFTTSKELARHAARTVRNVGGTTIGVVLNAVDLHRNDYHYYSYQRDGYSSNTESVVPPEAPAPSV
ncbi:MAG: GumC family protein [Myxococcota bacterium]